VLNEFKDLIDPKALPKRRKYLHYYIVGLVDGEGCFSISIKKQDDARFGWVIDPVFQVTQSKGHRVVLEILRRVFDCGRIIPKPGQEESTCIYLVDSRQNLVEKIIPFFKKHQPIIKQREFQRFAEIVEGLQKGEHRSLEGFKKLLQKAHEASTDRKRRLSDIVSSIEGGRLRDHMPSAVEGD
jgi:hypothetical protein